MNYAEGMEALNDRRKLIAALREEMRGLKSEIEPEEVDDWEFQTVDGPVELSDLFQGGDELIMIHNMGRNCSYCTLWGDGFNGVYEHLANRAAFVVCSPDSPADQKAFAESRGWRFPMVSHQGTTFAQAMGFHSQEQGFMPGVSVFQRRVDRIFRVADTWFGPDDDFCAVWHLFDLLPEGANGWHPKYKYPAATEAA